MSELVLQNSDVITSIEEKVDVKKILIKKNDIKFLIDITIMAVFNVMLITWNPYVEIPLVIGLFIASQVMRININRFKRENNVELK